MENELEIPIGSQEPELIDTQVRDNKGDDEILALQSTKRVKNKIKLMMRFWRSQ